MFVHVTEKQPHPESLCVVIFVHYALGSILYKWSFLCRQRSIAANRDHFARRLSPSVR